MTTPVPHPPQNTPDDTDDYGDALAAFYVALARVPLPAGATEVNRWEWDTDGDIDDTWFRFFYGTCRGNASAHEVNIVGRQAADGTIDERFMFVRGDEGSYRQSIWFDSPQAAREAAADMLAAADDWEAALVAEKQPDAGVMACPLCDGRGDIETDNTVNCAHAN
jgi:hypothetical protein